MQAWSRLDQWLDQKQISIKMTRVMANPHWVDDQAFETVEHFRCRLFKSGRFLDLYLSVMAGDDVIGPYEALFMLAMDGASCKLLEEYQPFREDWISDLGEGDKMMATEAMAFWKEYAARCSQQRRLRAFLGDSVYDEMLGRIDARSEHTQAS
jgi:hypothetical protein